MDHGAVRPHQSKEENAFTNGLRYRWTFQGSLHPSEQDSIIEACPVEHYGELCLPVSICSEGERDLYETNSNDPTSGVFPSRMTAFGMKYLDALLERHPTGRVGKASDFAGLILFLSSSGAAHMTGNVLEIDGGSTRSGWRAPKKDNKL